MEVFPLLLVSSIQFLTYGFHAVNVIDGLMSLICTYCYMFVSDSAIQHIECECVCGNICVSV